jgi:hypothetical protein
MIPKAERKRCAWPDDLNRLITLVFTLSLAARGTMGGATTRQGWPAAIAPGLELLTRVR